MILELAILDVKPGETEAFETAFAEAKTIISAMPGFGRLGRRSFLACAPDTVRTYAPASLSS